MLRGAESTPEPVFSVGSGVFTNSTITFSITAPIGTVRYTLDGSVPTEASAPYSGPITVGTNAVIKARTFAGGFEPGKQARPGSDYRHSLKLLKDFKARFPAIPAKSGLMVGLGETDEEIVEVMRDLRAHDVDMLTIGQYLQPSAHHLPVLRYVEPAVFDRFAEIAQALGFMHAASGPLVRSSYHADQQAHEAGVG